VASFGNPARERLKNGELSIGVGVRLARTVEIASAMKTCGFDWLFIDLEHGSMSVDAAVQISLAANHVGISPIVRVPNGQYDMATRALDGGAAGIVVPHVDTAEEAREAVERLKYPPVGHRSIAGPLAQFDFRALPAAEASTAMNAGMLLVVMLETPKAIENAGAIAAVPNLDVLLIGTGDLSMEMGIPGQVMDPRIGQAYAKVAAACQAGGKWLGMGGVYSEEGLRKYIAAGARMILSGSDFNFAMAAAASRATFLRELK
jgi:4-hydroxy-2-oxoheptanedioate aldolase